MNRGSYLDHMLQLATAEHGDPLEQAVRGRVEQGEGPPLDRESYHGGQLLTRVYSRLQRQGETEACARLRHVVARLLKRQLLAKNYDFEVIDAYNYLLASFDLREDEALCKALSEDLLGLLYSRFDLSVAELYELDGRDLRLVTRVLDLWLVTQPMYPRGQEPPRNVHDDLTTLFEGAVRDLKKLGGELSEDRVRFVFTCFHVVMLVDAEWVGVSGVPCMLELLNKCNWHHRERLREEWLGLCSIYRDWFEVFPSWRERFERGLERLVVSQVQKSLWTETRQELGLDQVEVQEPIPQKDMVVMRKIGT